MTGRTGKKPASRLLGLVVVLFCAISAAAGDEGLPTGLSLQPKGLEHVGIYAVRDLDPDLTGAGVKYAVICRSVSYDGANPANDYRPAIGHDCFAHARVNFYDDGQPAAGTSPHATALCSILFGNDPTAFHPDMAGFFYQGAAPQAIANVYEYEYFLLDSVARQRPPDEDILAAALGVPFEDCWTRCFEAMAEHYGIVVVAGIGNGRDADHTVLYPGAGANAIGVGVVDSVNTADPATNLAYFGLAHPEQSSFGAAGKGHSKPDIVAPGNCLAAMVDEPNGYEPTGDWSSFATPVVAGAVGLLVQKAKQEPELRAAVAPSGGNCVIKAILLNSARKLPYWHKGKLEPDDDYITPLDQIQGAGMLDALSAYKHLTAGQMKPGNVLTTGWDLSPLTASGSPGNAYRFVLDDPNNSVITATVTWNRHYNRDYPFDPAPEKDGNLRLELWGVDPADPANDDLLYYSDSPVDNVEHIHFSASNAYTNYEVVVSFSDIEAGAEANPDQLYGLAWTVGEKQDTDNIFSYDLNADGIVDGQDIILALNSLTESDESSERYLLGDRNGDGEIDAEDLAELLNQTKNNRRADWHVEPENKAG